LARVTRHTIPVIWQSIQDILLFFSCAWCAFQISYANSLWWGFLQVSSLFVLTLFLCCDKFLTQKHINVPSLIFCFIPGILEDEWWSINCHQLSGTTCYVHDESCRVSSVLNVWWIIEYMPWKIWVEMGWSFLWHQSQVLLTTTKMNPPECRWVDLFFWHCSLQTFRREDCTCMNASVDLTVVSWFWIY
jgi:hypothetical protein